MKAPKSRIYPNATPVYYVEPSAEISMKDGPLQEPLGPFSSKEEADEVCVRAYEDWGGEKTCLDKDPIDRPEHPFVVTYFKAPARVVLPFEDVLANALRADLSFLSSYAEDLLYDKLGDDVTAPSIFTGALNNAALGRVAGKLAAAMRDEGLDVSASEVRWYEEE